jgi:hypothetical protein
VNNGQEGETRLTRPYVRPPVPPAPLASFLSDGSGDGEPDDQHSGPEPGTEWPRLPRHRRPGPPLTGPGLTDAPGSTRDA